MQQFLISEGLILSHNYSSLFSQTQKPWHSTTKELYAVIKCLMRFQRYYFNSNKSIFIFTDCNYVISALKHAQTQKNTKYLRWINYLNGMKMILIHKPGKMNTMADFLSRSYFTPNIDN